MKIAHISDLHLSRLSLSPAQFFSKQWLGNVNLLFSRKKDFVEERLQLLPDLFSQEKVSQVLITGDLSTTGQKNEFKAAKQLVESIERKGIRTLVIPGNHDHYTKKGYQEKWFYDFFPHTYDTTLTDYNLKDQGVAVYPLSQNWWVVALDTALSTSWISSRGLFSVKVETFLEEVLAKVPKNAHILLMNHFPFFQHQNKRKTLERGEALQALIRKHPNIKLYLNGHTHTQCLADLRVDQLPILVDPGCTSHRERGGLNLIALQGDCVEIEVFGWKESWKVQRKTLLQL